MASPRPLKVKTRTQRIFVYTRIVFCVQVADIVNRHHSYILLALLCVIGVIL